jgi:diacylglycerol kinase (ATP)
VSRALVVVNPAAGRGRAARIWAAAVAGLDAGLDGVECVLSGGPGDARRLAGAAVTRGLQRVVAVGGDGTVSEVADALVGTPLALGVVAAGTGNDFARALGVPRAPPLALRVALDGGCRKIDVGQVRTTQGGSTFVNVAGCGFDAEVVCRTRSARAGGGWLVYFAGVVRTLRGFRPPLVQIECTGQPARRRRVVGIAVANGPRYGGGMRIAPGAALDDGWLDVCVLGDVGAVRLAAMLPRIYAGTHGAHPAVEFFRCRELRVAPAEPGMVGCQADGELIGSLPATFTVQPGSLRCAVGARA